MRAPPAPGRVRVLAQRDNLAKLRAGPLPLVEVARAPDPRED